MYVREEKTKRGQAGLEVDKREDGTPTLARTRSPDKLTLARLCSKRILQTQAKPSYAYRRGENGNGFKICEFMLEHSFAVRATVELHCSFSQLCARRALRASRSSYCHMWCTWCRWPICLLSSVRFLSLQVLGPRLEQADSREPRSDGVVTSRDSCLQTDSPVVQIG